MANIPTLQRAALSEFSIARRLRSIARGRLAHARECIVWSASVVIAAGVPFVASFAATNLYDVRAIVANALPSVARGDWLLAGAACVPFALAAAMLWRRARMLDAGIRQLAAAIDAHGADALPAAPARCTAPSIAMLTRAIDDAHRQRAERVTELLHVLAAYAHDLRTPLTRMMLRSGMLDDRALREAMERDLAEMNELVDASLACARLQCSVAEAPRRVDADELLGVLVDNYRDAGSTVDLDGRIGRPLVTCPHALRRVLVNLIDNALRYGGDVRLCVRVEARRVTLSVMDSGPGIVPAELDAVFAPWYRAPQTSARAPGSGLGLAIARRLTQAMQGELQLNNRSTGGLEARVTLPLAVA